MNLRSFHVLEELDICKINDYVVVKLIYDKNTKKEQEKIFANQIDKISGKDMHLNFLRRKGTTTQFYFPQIPDKQTVMKNNILKKLKSVDIYTSTMQLNLFAKLTL